MSVSRTVLYKYCTVRQIVQELQLRRTFEISFNERILHHFVSFSKMFQPVELFETSATSFRSPVEMMV